MLERWHDFYLTVGAGSATLVGLLFVSVTLRLEALERLADAKNLALQSFGSFVSIFLVALAVLAPIPEPLMAVVIVVPMTMLLWAALGIVPRFFQIRVARLRWALLSNFGPTVVGRIGLIAGAVLLWLGRPEAALTLGVSSAWLIGFAARNSWNLLMRLGDPDVAALDEQRRAAGGK